MWLAGYWGAPGQAVPIMAASTKEELLAAIASAATAGEGSQQRPSAAAGSQAQEPSPLPGGSTAAASAASLYCSECLDDTLATQSGDAGGASSAHSDSVLQGDTAAWPPPQLALEQVAVPKRRRQAEVGRASSGSGGRLPRAAKRERLDSPAGDDTPPRATAGMGRAEQEQHVPSLPTPHELAQPAGPAQAMPPAAAVAVPTATNTTQEATSEVASESEAAAELLAVAAGPASRETSDPAAAALLAPLSPPPGAAATAVAVSSLTSPRSALQLRSSGTAVESVGPAPYVAFSLPVPGGEGAAPYTAGQPPPHALALASLRHALMPCRRSPCAPHGVPLPLPEVPLRLRRGPAGAHRAAPLCR